MNAPFKSAGALALVSISLLMGCNDHTNTNPVVASASVNVVNTSGSQVGTARLTQMVGQPVSMTLTVSGLPAGIHGIHFHEVGVADPRATPPFSTAGEHYNPESHQHGLDNPNGIHAGDLQNLIVDPQGNAVFYATTDRITLTDGPRSLFDGNGSSLIIHANADDQRTDPSGNSGGRIAGGVVMRN